MKLGPVTKLDKRYKTTSQKFGYNVMSANCDVIVIFPIYAQFIAQIIIIVTIYLINNWKQN